MTATAREEHIARLREIAAREALRGEDFAEADEHLTALREAYKADPSWCDAATGETLRSLKAQLAARRAMILMDRRAALKDRKSQLDEKREALLEEIRAVEAELASALGDLPGESLQAESGRISVQRYIAVRKAGEKSVDGRILAEAGMDDCVQVSYGRLRKRVVSAWNDFARGKTITPELFDQFRRDFLARHPSLDGVIDIREESRLKESFAPEAPPPGA